MSTLIQQAIQSALKGDWKEAILLNEQIIKNDESNIEALNRLAYAYLQLKKIEAAKKIYRKIISLDKYNIIAQKNLAKLNTYPKEVKSRKYQNNSTVISPCIFLEEPGKTKTVALKNLAPLSTLVRFQVGAPVFLQPKKNSIEIRDSKNVYLGALPDDLTYRLLHFIKAGNCYQACLKNIQKNCVFIFIREVKRGKKFQHQPSFLLGNTSSSFSLSTPKAFRKALKPDREDEDSETVDQEEVEE